ncbi:hypothetical protein NKG05_07480 [Oerskovia sp. M15]
MRKLVYYVAATLDGYIAGPDGGDPSGTDYLPVTPDLVQFIVEHFPRPCPARPARPWGSTDRARSSTPSSRGARRTRSGWPPASPMPTPTCGTSSSRRA